MSSHRNAPPHAAASATPTSPFFRGPLYAAAIQDHLARLHLHAAGSGSGTSSTGSRLGLAATPLPSLGGRCGTNVARKPAMPLSTRQRQLLRWSKDMERQKRQQAAAMAAMSDAATVALSKSVDALCIASAAGPDTPPATTTTAAAQIQRRGGMHGHVHMTATKTASRRVQGSCYAEEPDMDRILDGNTRPLTLAEKLGIVPKPPDPLSPSDWAAIKSKTSARGDLSHPCPICQEPFTTQSQILLSCSHIFHQACIQSYESYVQQRCCPLCRETDYERLLTNAGRKAYRVRCAVKIQAAWRMARQARAYAEYRRTHPPKDPKLLAKYHLNKLAMCSQALVASMASSSYELQEVLQDLDADLQSSRQIINSTTATMESLQSQGHSGSHAGAGPSSRVDWDEALLKAAEREDEACPICIMPLTDDGSFTLAATASTKRRTCGSSIARITGELPVKTDKAGATTCARSGHRQTAIKRAARKSLALLSCSHVFHTTCIQCLERFDIHSQSHVCPVCRCQYERIDIEA
ncbi:hypothetical protein BC831DRAFT_461657 [Entophlyctis helioformis]|nr:hypothetical protein BC831DRAFT_461657 [Entophlyctis helioformis]